MEKSLLRLTGFIPFLLVAFFNAIVDTGHKIIVQNTVFKIYDGELQMILIAIVNGLILLPFVLTLSPAGFLSDKFAKHKVIRMASAAAIVITLLITASYYLGWFKIAFALTLILAIQSAFYSPAKYGYLKELVGKKSLASANGILQSVTIVSILFAVFIFSVFFEKSLGSVTYQNEAELIQHIAPLGWLLVLMSIVEFLLTLKMSRLKPANEAQHFDSKTYMQGSYLKSNLGKVRSNRNIWLSVVGVAVVWGVSQAVLASFPSYAKEVFGETNTVVIQGLMAMAGVGVVLGSLFAAATSRKHIELGLVPVGALGVVIGMFMMTRLELGLPLTINFILFGFSAGMFMVPLNSMIQYHAKESDLGSTIAANNWFQNVIMLAFLAATVIAAIVGLGSRGLFHLLTLLALAGTVYTVYLLPHSLIRFVVARFFAGRYHVQIQGFENMPTEGAVLLLGNHISWLDWAILQIATPRKIHFVMARKIYNLWYLRWLMDLFGVIPISAGHSKEALDRVNEYLKQGEVVCLFPEGALSRNGQLGRFRTGFERTVEDVDGVIVPFYLRGLWGSRFSHASPNMKQQRRDGLRRTVIVAFGESLPIASKAPEVKQSVADLSIHTWEAYTETLDTIPRAWIKTVKKQGEKLSLAEATGVMELSANKTLTGAIVFSQRIKKHSPEQNVGLLLPTSSVGVMFNMSTFLAGKTVVNLNYTASVNALVSAVEKAEIKTIYSSEKFINKLKQRGIDLQPVLDKTNVIVLEELKDEIKPWQKMVTMLAVKLLPAALLNFFYTAPSSLEQPAAILFSSGSEGEPKGVVLTHRNIMGNIKQVSDVLDTRINDVVMDSLPLFHAFGLTITSLMPLIEGMPAICHPDPTDVLNIAKGMARYRATIFCGTSTFLRLFTRNRKVSPLMLESLRVVVAGAERLNPEVRDGFKQKFDKNIYEGYGTTETTPVAGVNIPDRLNVKDWSIQHGTKAGSIGMALPGSSFRIVDPETLEQLPTEEDGLILIGGTQIMQGYLHDEEKTKAAIVHQDDLRWYNTGDKGHIDEDGFLTIVDRYSRFAKIGGEMISLGAVESAINAIVPEDVEVLATAIPDGKKGERVVLLFSGSITEIDLKYFVREKSELLPLMQPSTYIHVETLPKLGSGKSDFNHAKQIALEAA